MPKWTPAEKAIRSFAFWDYGMDGVDPKSEYAEWVPDLAAAVEKAVREQIKVQEQGWNEAIDWLLNSRHTGDPDIQAAFWLLAEGKCTRKEADAGFMDDGRSLLEVQAVLDA